MPMILQAKILRVLQERELRRLGGNELVQLDVRVIAATNRDLAERVVEKEFREDLFYRLNVFPLQLSALRDRIEDILPIANALIKKHRKLMGRAYKLSKETQDFLKLYPWPGNVRELENVIQRAMVLAVDGVIEVEHLLLEDYSTASTQVKDADQRLTAEREQAQQIMNEMAQPSVDQTPSDEGLSDLTWKSESKVILDTLSRFSGNRKNTAEKLGISPRTLRYKLAKLKEEGVAVP
jgi:two-component system response regulator FlrC